MQDSGIYYPISFRAKIQKMANAQKRHFDPKRRHSPLTQIVAIPLKSSNAFLIKGQKAILVDSGSPKDAVTLLKAIEEADVDLEDISLIIHTHGHVDHCGCTAELKKRTNAAVAIHRADAQYLSAGTNAPTVPVDLFGRILMPILERLGPFEPVVPDIQFDHELDLSPYGVNGKAISTPGHTDGSISILLPDSAEAIVGDIIGGGWLLGFFRPGRPRYHHWYTDYDAAQKSLSKILDFKPETFYVGHGGPLEGIEAVKYFSTVGL